MKVNMFTCKPVISAIFHVMRQLRWKNIQWYEGTKLVSKNKFMQKEKKAKKRKIVGVDHIKLRS